MARLAGPVAAMTRPGHPNGWSGSVRVRLATDGLAGGVTVGPVGPDGAVVVDGVPLPVDYRGLDEIHGSLAIDGASARVLLGAVRRRSNDGVLIREIGVDGWLFDVEVESAARVALRERAQRGRPDRPQAGSREIRAVIPGKLVRVAVAPGDAVVAGQPLVVLEAMKMQNEVRATGDGTVERVLLSVGENVEVGDLLVILL